MDNDKHLVYVGTNSLRGSEGIYTVVLDGGTGKMEIVATTPAQDAAYLCLDNSRTNLYAVIESLAYEGKEGGGVAAYQLDGGVPVLQCRHYAQGGYPCHISMSTDGKCVYVSVFLDGLWQVYPIGQSGELLPAASSVRHFGLNGHTSRIHAAIPSPDGEHVLVADCGLDRVYVYNAHTWELEETAHFPQGSNPRQLCFGKDGRQLYLLTEVSCELYRIEYHPGGESLLCVKESLSALRRDGYQGPNYGGALCLHTSGRYLLATNRGHNSIAVFSVDPGSGRPSLLHHKMLAGDHCRDLAFTPDGRLLVAGMQHTDVVQSFFFNEANGEIADTGYSLAIPSPSAVVM